MFLTLSRTDIKSTVDVVVLAHTHTIVAFNSGLYYILYVVGLLGVLCIFSSVPLLRFSILSWVISCDETVCRVKMKAVEHFCFITFSDFFPPKTRNDTPDY